MSPCITWLNKKTNVKRSFWSMLMIFAAIIISGAIFYFAYRRAADTIENFVTTYVGDSDRLLELWTEFTTTMAERFPMIAQLFENRLVSSLVTDGLISFAGRISSAIPGYITGVLGRVPNILLFAGVLLISNYYFSVNYHEINRWFYSKFSEKTGTKIRNARKNFASATKRYLRSAAILFSMTFAQLLAGFLFFRINHAILLAFLISIVDILPVLGVGTVLLPWILVLFIFGNYYTAVGLLILYVVVTIVRQVSEPKIIGKQMGLHPLVTLMVIYAGFKLFGIAGVFLGPIFAFLVVAIIKEHKGETSPPKPKRRLIKLSKR